MPSFQEVQITEDFMVTFIGIVWIILGLCMLASPVIVGIFSVQVIGSLMIAASLIEFIRIFKAQTPILRITWFLGGLITLFSGILVLVHPIFGLSFLTLLLTIYFFADGCIKIAAAYKHRYGRGWFLTSGILSFLLAYLIWINWPLSGALAIGVLVGINFVFTGLTLLATRKTPI